MQLLLASPTTEFVICISINIRDSEPSHYFPLREVSSRVLAWGPLRSRSLHHPTAATKCKVGRHANKPRQWKSMLTHQRWFNLLYMQPLLASQTTEFVICISIYFISATLNRHKCLAEYFDFFFRFFIFVQNIDGGYTLRRF